MNIAVSPWLLDQAQRLAALSALGLTNSPDEEFDRIALRATQLCDAPIALVTLVAEDRQWFKSRIGFNFSETSLDASVCKHTLDKSDLLIIPDLTVDKRTRDNPLVAGEPYIRFYAGARIVADGVPVGAICVIDTKTRSHLTSIQIVSLEGLAFECSFLLNKLGNRAPRAGNHIRLKW